MAWTVKIEIDVENDAFAFADNFAGAVAGVLQETAQKVEAEGLPRWPHRLTIRDENGNAIGSLTYRNEEG